MSPLGAIRPEILADETRPFSLLLGARSQQFLLPLHLLTFTYSSQTHSLRLNPYA